VSQKTLAVKNAISGRLKISKTFPLIQGNAITETTCCLSGASRCSPTISQ